MFKKIITAVVTVCICLCFCGCAFIDNTEEMLSPPELTGEMSPIAKALYDVAGNECDLKYPASGNYRSAIVLEDINGDGVFEAFAFYSTSGDEMTTMHINVICQKDEKWESVADQTIVATGVEMVDFCDLNNDGKKEILVGWDVNGTNEKQLSAFTFNKNKLTQQMLQSYTNFLCCDIDTDGTNEVFVHHLDVVEKTNSAMIYNFDGKSITMTANCPMNANVKSASTPVLSTLSDGQKAIYIDEIKGVDAITEVLYFSNDELVNPLLDTTNMFENISTSRAASISTKDINGDGILEIPIASELPNAQSEGEGLYYTNWCAFDGYKLTQKLVTVVNTVDGYYLEIPNNMVGKLAILKDIENHKREVYRYDYENDAIGKSLFTITAIDIRKWENKDYDRGNKKKIATSGNIVFVATLGEGAEEFGITIDFIKEKFKTVD